MSTQEPIGKSNGEHLHEPIGHDWEEFTIGEYICFTTVDGRHGYGAVWDVYRKDGVLIGYSVDVCDSRGPVFIPVEAARNLSVSGSSNDEDRHHEVTDADVGYVCQKITATPFVDHRDIRQERPGTVDLSYLLLKLAKRAVKIDGCENGTTTIALRDAITQFANLVSRIFGPEEQEPQ